MSETKSTAKFNSQIIAFGINPSKIYRNLSVEKLVEIAVEKNEGMVTSTGSLSVKTGRYTGRSPDDRFIVFDDLTHDKVHWGKVNKQFPTETFDKLYQKMKKFVDGKELFVFDGFVGADPENRLPIRIINDHAWQSLFAHQLFIRPSAAELEDHEPELTVMCINDFEAIPEVDSTMSNAFILINLSKKLVLIGATSYAGEIKKSILFFVFFNLERRNSIASIVPIELNIFLKTFILSKSSFLKSNSSLLVPDLVISIAGKILLSEIFLSNINSLLPVPLNSSKITSSILLPVSISAVEIIVSEPPCSIFLAAPKNLFGLCRALASTPPVNTLPELGMTAL